MKNFIILIISCIILSLIFIYENNYLENTTRYLLADINHIENLINNNNYNAANKFLKTYKKSWNEIKKIWSLFINNNEINDIDENIIKCEEYIKQNKKEESLVYIKCLNQMHKSIYERKLLKFENII